MKQALPSIENDPRYRTGQIINTVVEQTEKHFPAARGLILTGSTARGESTAIVNSEGVSWLSDVELLVVVKDRSVIRDVLPTLKQIRMLTEDHLAQAGIIVSIELTPAPEDYFHRIRPHLFGYELLLHGKQLVGTEDYLALIPRFEPSEIPREDAWRLLSNRMVEWLDLLVNKDTLSAQLEFYTLTKQYLDLITSLSIFAGLYKASYKERAAQADQLKKWLGQHLPSLPGSGLLEASAIAADFKANSDADEFRWLRDGEKADLRSRLKLAGMEWLQDGLPLITATAWTWELAQISGRQIPHADGALQALRGNQRWKDWMLGWGRIVARPHLRTGTLFFQRMPFLAPQGTPRNLVYVCAEQLLRTHGKRDQEVLSWVRNHLPAPRDDSRIDWDTLTIQCVSNWRMFVRMTQT